MTPRAAIAQGLALWNPEVLTDTDAARAFVAFVEARAEGAEVTRRLRAVERAYGVNLGLPMIFARLRRSQPTRRADWAEQASSVLSAYDALEQSLTNRRGSADLFAGKALASAILRSALLRPELWPPFLRAIETRQPFGRSAQLGDLVWLTLRVQRGLGRVAQSDDWESVRLYLDVVTLSLIRRAHGARLNVRTPEACLEMAMAAIGAQGVTVSAIQQAGFAAIEDRAQDPIPQVLFEVARGSVAAFSVTEDLWRKALSGQEGAVAHSAPERMPSAEIEADLSVDLSVLRFKSALLTEMPQAKKRTPAPVLRALNGVVRDQPVPVIRALSLWMLDLLARRRAVSTVLRYGVALANLLAASFGRLDPASCVAGEIESRLEDALETVPSRERIYRAARLAQFLQFASNDPRLNWPDVQLEVEGGARPRVRTAQVGAVQIDQALALFRGDPMAQAAVLLGARGGLRLSDMEALRVGDVELDLEGWVMIHQTRWGDLKSSSGRRKVPFSLLLTAAQKRIWSQFVMARRADGAPDAPLLATVVGFGTFVRFDRNAFGRKLAQIGLRPHDLRHGALSNLALVLLSPASAQAEVSTLTGWKTDAIARLRAWLTTRDPLYGPRNLARLAGHRDPSTTFQTYIHLADLALGLHLRAQDGLRPADQVARMLGLNQARLGRRKHYTPENLRAVVVGQLAVEQIGPPPPKVAALIAPLQGVLSVEHVLRVMAQLQKGDPTPVVAEVQGAPLRVVNALARLPALPRLKSRKDQSAALALVKQVLAVPEAQVWAAMTLRAPMRGIVLEQARARKWGEVFEPVMRVEREYLPRAQRLIPVAPSGMTGMALPMLAARIVQAWWTAKEAAGEQGTSRKLI